MRRLIILGLFVFVGLTVKAQEFNLGLSAAKPISEAGDLFSSAFILDAEYLHKMSEKIKLGATTGYIFSTGNNDYTRVSLTGGSSIGLFQVENTGFIPLAASLRFRAIERLTFGTDLGYAFGVKPQNAESGFYFALKAEYQVKDYLYLTTSFRSIILDDTRPPSEFDARDDNFYLNLLSFGVLIKL